MKTISSDAAILQHVATTDDSHPADSPSFSRDGSILVPEQTKTVSRWTSTGAAFPGWQKPDLGGATRTPLVLTSSTPFVVSTAKGAIHSLRPDGSIAWSGQLSAGTASLQPGNIYTPPGQVSDVLSTAYFAGSDGVLLRRHRRRRARRSRPLAQGVPRPAEHEPCRGAAVIRRLALLLAVLAAAPATAFETLAVLAAGEPPGGPDADLAELAHQLRAACRDRIGGVQDVPTMRARLLGQRSNATVTELDRAYGGALAVYQNGEFESAIRTLKAIVEDLESLPETDESYAQWVRAQLRLAHAALTIGREREADDAMFAVARTDPAVQPDAEQYSPTYRRRFDAVKAKVRALPARRLQVTAEGFGGVVYVNGRQMGAAPLSLWLPAGSYRIGGASGSLHVPSFRVDLEGRTARWSSTSRSPRRSA